MIIKRVRLSDLQTCIDIATKEFGYSTQRKQTYRSLIKAGTVYMLKDKGNVIGFLCYIRDFSHGANYIEDIVIAKEHRKKGLAKLLLKKYLEVSKKETPNRQKYALSSTNVENKISIKMHLTFGFKKLGVVKGLHYGKDEIIFGYKLK